MSAPSRIYHNESAGSLMFICPGCAFPHVLNVGAVKRPHWDWNGDVERPTIKPSIQVTLPANPDASEEFKEWRKERRCHSFVTDGRIQFLVDSTHALAGQTVDLPDIQSQ